MDLYITLLQNSSIMTYSNTGPPLGRNESRKQKPRGCNKFEVRKTKTKATNAIQKVRILYGYIRLYTAIKGYIRIYKNI